MIAVLNDFWGAYAKVLGVIKELRPGQSAHLIILTTELFQEYGGTYPSQSTDIQSEDLG